MCLSKMLSDGHWNFLAIKLINWVQLNYLSFLTEILSPTRIFRYQMGCRTKDFQIIKASIQKQDLGVLLAC